jgi:dethiobiotin synthetase
MHIFITGTDTNIGKTLVSSWLCLHTLYDYFKPIQTGAEQGTDSASVANLTLAKIWPENFIYKTPLSPHLSARIENKEIDVNKIILPKTKNLIVEGAGGVMTPINAKYLMIDLINMIGLPTIVVASSKLGTINHTLLTLQALKTKAIEVLGVIVSGQKNADNCQAIEYYGKTKVLAQLPHLAQINTASLASISLTNDLQQIFKI